VSYFWRLFKWSFPLWLGALLLMAGYLFAAFNGVNRWHESPVEESSLPPPIEYRFNDEGRLVSLSFDDKAGYKHIWDFATGDAALSESCLTPWGSAFHGKNWDADGDLKTYQVHHSVRVADCSRGPFDPAGLGPVSSQQLEGIYFKGNTRVAAEDLAVLKTFPNLKWVNVKQTWLNPAKLEALLARDGEPIRVVH